MINLLKTFGKGVLYAIGFPFFLIALVLFGVIGLFAFIFQVFKSIIYFFTGQKFFPELPEDKKLRLLKEGASQPVESNTYEEPQSIISPIEEEPVVLSRNPEPFVAPSNEEATFEEPIQEEIPEEPVEDIPEEENVPKEEHTVLETVSEPGETEEPMEELETYVPRSSTYSDADDDDNDTSTGVKIDFDL